MSSHTGTRLPLCTTTMTALFHDKHSQRQTPSPVSRVRVSARITATAYDALIELQRRHRRQTGKALRLWEILDAAVITYAKANGIKVRS